MTPLEDRLFALEKALISVAITYGWQHKYAKFSRVSKTGNQSVLVHAVNVFSIAHVLATKVYKLADDEVYFSCLAAFMHDLQKTADSWQEAALRFLGGEKPDERAFDHDNGSAEALQEMRQFLGEVEKRLAADTKQPVTLTSAVERVLNVLVYTHDSDNKARAALRQKQVGARDERAYLIRIADSIASMKDPSEAPSRMNDPDFPRHLQVSLTYHSISKIRGLVSGYLNEAIVRLMEEAGYTPLLYFANGAVYVLVGRAQTIPTPQERLKSFIQQLADGFSQSDVFMDSIRDAAVGPVTQTLWPCLNMVKEDHISEIVDSISGRQAREKGPTDGAEFYEKVREKPQHLSAVQDFVKKAGSVKDQDNILATMLSDFILLIYMVGFLKDYGGFVPKEKFDEYRSDVDSWLRAHVGDLTLADLSDVSNTSEPDVKVRATARLWKMGPDSMLKRGDRRQAIVDGFKEVLGNVLRKYKGYAPHLLSDEATRILLTDIRQIPLAIASDSEVHFLSEEISARYSKGKDRGRVCGFCGAPSYQDAPAALFGDGSQKFTNQLRAGVTFGNGKKAQVCALCTAEGTLRKFFFSETPAFTFFVMPDLSLSPDLARLWSDEVNSFLRTEKLGLSIGSTWNMMDVYRTFSRGNSVPDAYSVSSLLRPSSAGVKKLAEFLEVKLGSPSKVRLSGGTMEPGEHTFEDIATAHFKDTIKIDSRQLEGYAPPVRNQASAYTTPSYMMFFFRHPLADDDGESTSTRTLRTYLLGLIVTETFHARVVSVDGFEPLTDLAIEGVVRVSTPPPASIALRSLGIGQIVTIDRTQEALRKLTSLALIAMDYAKGLGKDRLLRMATMNRGAILRRAQMDTKNSERAPIRRLMDLLEGLPAFIQDKM